MKRRTILTLLSISMIGISAGRTSAAPINQPTSALAGVDHILLTFDHDGDGVPLPVNVGTECFSPPFENCTFPAAEYAAFGITLLPQTRVSEDNSACLRAQVTAGGSGPFGLIGANTDQILFDPPVEAFEFWVVTALTSPFSFTAYDGNDLPIETVTMAGTTLVCGTVPLQRGFIGINSLTPIHRVDVNSGFGILDQLRMVPVVAEVIDLTLTSECSEDPDATRRWRVTNPNDFDVDVTWQVDGTAQTGVLVAPPGDSFFDTTTEPGDNTTTITWLDESNDPQSASTLSGGVACDDDNDGLPNKDEPTYGTDPNDPDSDNDGLLDGEEVGLAMGTGCPDPTDADSDNDGDGDGVDNNVCNAPPSASIVVEQLTSIGATARVRLDGLGSSDDDPVTELSYVWTVDGNIVCNGDNATCGSIQVNLSYGDHEVTLLVTDTDGDSGSATTFVTIDPAQLSVLEIDKARVRFNPNNPRIRLVGEIGLPFGVNFSELSPEVSVMVDVAGIGALPLTDVSLTETGLVDRKWQYESETGQIRSLNINWQGTRFHFVEDNYPIKLKTDIITSSETIISLIYKRKQIGAGFTMSFDGLANVSVNANGDATADVPLEVEILKHTVSLTLPFPITDESVITISGFNNRTLDAADYLQASVGRYRLVANFDPALVPDGVNNPNRTVDLMMTVGDEMYFGATGLSSDQLCIDENRWLNCGDE